MLESERQAHRHDRNIKDSDRRKVLQRDNHTCQQCGWSHIKWNRSDPRHLEVHHRKHYARGGTNEPGNVVTFCNVCHDEIHRLERSSKAEV
ncbi:MAG: HNH endonuclease [Acidobacteria bacterium]|nr:HNH endonuclease [Acidobacteriota bacterium]